MNRDEFIQKLEKSYSDALEIMKKKNTDYAKQQDPFNNFRYATYCNVSVEKAILVRISDKFARVCNLIDKNGDIAVIDESISDTILDMANYLVILKTYLEDKK
jgi:hypothetical protein